MRPCLYNASLLNVVCLYNANVLHVVNMKSHRSEGFFYGFCRE